MSRDSLHSKNKNRHNPIKNSDTTVERESERSDDEEQYTYCLRTISVYERRRVRPQSELSAVAPEFQPMGRQRPLKYGS